ncbi:MAG: efflux RND transporter periplasmic adaptor subunit [Betaproteobacteria bacterium]|nr:efflux RND transporter periplasmic adaptor subunit [Betaproteobacteria bacterium]
MSFTKFILFALLSGAAAAVHAHEGEDHGAPAAAAVAPGSGAAATASPVRLPDGSVFVPKATQRLFGLRTTLAEMREISLGVELKGHVIPDPNASGRVQASQAGRIEPGPRGLPYLGQKVSKGQVLAYLAPVAGAIERGNQQAALAEIESQLAIAETKAARYEQLTGSIPQKEIDAANSELKSLKARKEAVAASLYQRQALTAPVAGVVSVASAAAGQVVEAKEVLFEIVDPQKLWLEAVAYDMQLAGQIGSASAEGVNGKPLKLTFLGAGYALREQALPLQFRLEPPLPPLSVGQPLKAFAETREKVRGAPIPNETMVRGSSGDVLVWVQASAERFVPRRVTVQPVSGAESAVTSGLKGGERVVTAAAALLAQVR